MNAWISTSKCKDLPTIFSSLRFACDQQDKVIRRKPRECQEKVLYSFIGLHRPQEQQDSLSLRQAETTTRKCSVYWRTVYTDVVPDRHRVYVPVAPESTIQNASRVFTMDYNGMCDYREALPHSTIQNAVLSLMGIQVVHSPHDPVSERTRQRQLDREKKT